MARNGWRYDEPGVPSVIVKGDPWAITGSGTGTDLTVTQSGASGNAWEVTYVTAGGTQNGVAILKVDGTAVWHGRFPSNGMCGQKFEGEIRGDDNEDIDLEVVLESSGDIVSNIGGVDGKNPDSRFNNPPDNF